MRLEFLEEKEVLFETVEARDPPSTCELLNFEEHLWNSSSLKLPEIPRDLTWHYLTFNKSESYARDDDVASGVRRNFVLNCYL